MCISSRLRCVPAPILRRRANKLGRRSPHLDVMVSVFTSSVATHYWINQCAPFAYARQLAIASQEGFCSSPQVMYMSGLQTSMIGWLILCTVMWLLVVCESAWLLGAGICGVLRSPQRSKALWGGERTPNGKRVDLRLDHGRYAK